MMCPVFCVEVVATNNNFAEILRNNSSILYFESIFFYINPNWFSWRYFCHIKLILILRDPNNLLKIWKIFFTLSGCRSYFALTGEFESQQISKFKLGFSSVNILVYFNLFQDIKLQNTNNH